MKTLNKKAIIVTSIPKMYSDSELTALSSGTLYNDNEIEIAEVNEKNNSVKVILPDSTVAYMHGEEQLHVIQPSWTTKDTELFISPNESANHSKVLSKGEEFELLNIVDGTDEKWIRVRLSREQIYYMKANEKVITEDSLANSIAELIGEGNDQDTVVRKFAKQGISEEKIVNLYNEITKLAAEYEKSPEGRKELANGFSRKIFFGFLWAIGGTIATLVSMDAASEGGTYYIFWGAIVFGAYDILKGVFGYIKYSV